MFASVDEPPPAPTWVQDAAQQLPQRPANKGPTLGRLFGRDGHELIDAPIWSGENPRTVADLHPTLRNWVSPLGHVESHAAAMIRRGEVPKDAVLVINNRPCAGIRGCDRLLSAMLPKGSRLTVYVTDGQRTWLHRAYDGTGEGIK